MPSKRVVIVLPEVDRVRWQGAADLRGVPVERFVRDAVEAAIERSQPVYAHDVPCGCGIDRMCDRCVDDAFAHLKGVCACRADTWVAELAVKRRGPWVPWPTGSVKVREAAMRWVEDLARDPGLRDRLAAEVEAWAAKRWDALATSRTDDVSHRLP